MPGYKVRHQCDGIADGMATVVPLDGDMFFEGYSYDILDTLKEIMRGHYVRMNVHWSVLDECEKGCAHND